MHVKPWIWQRVSSEINRKKKFFCHSTSSAANVEVYIYVQMVLDSKMLSHEVTIKQNDSRFIKLLGKLCSKSFYIPLGFDAVITSMQQSNRTTWRAMRAQVLIRLLQINDFEMKMWNWCRELSFLGISQAQNWFHVIVIMVSKKWNELNLFKQKRTPGKPKTNWMSKKISRKDKSVMSVISLTSFLNFKKFIADGGEK